MKTAFLMPQKKSCPNRVNMTETTTKFHDALTDEN